MNPTTLLRTVGPYAAAVALHALRLLPAALLCPFLGGPLVPAIVRMSLAVGLGACAWSAAGGAGFAGSVADLFVAAAGELAVGLALGFVASFPFEAARAGGRFVDTLRGATLSELHVAPLRQRESATGDLLAQWLVVLAGSVGGDRLVVSALLDTFRALPVGSAFASGSVLAAGLRGGAELLACALALGAPAAAGVLAADLAVSVALRGSRLPIASAAQPARAALGLVAIAIPAAAVAGRLTSTVALSAGLVRATAAGRLP